MPGIELRGPCVSCYGKGVQVLPGDEITAGVIQICPMCRANEQQTVRAIISHEAREIFAENLFPVNDPKL